MTMRYSQSYGQFLSIPIKMKFYKILSCRYRNLHKHQQLNLVIDAYYKIQFETITLFLTPFEVKLLQNFASSWQGCSTSQVWEQRVTKLGVRKIS